MVASHLTIPDLHSFRRVAKEAPCIAREQVVNGRHLATNVMTRALHLLPAPAVSAVRELVQEDRVVLSGSAALKVLSGDQWAASDTDLFGILDGSTVQAITIMLRSLSQAKILQKVGLMTTLTRRGGALAEDEGPQDRAPRLRDELSLAVQLVRCCQRLPAVKVTAAESYSKVGCILVQRLITRVIAYPDVSDEAKLDRIQQSVECQQQLGSFKRSSVT
jgi:hypothetical protein